MHVNTTMCVDRGGKGERARHVIGLWMDGTVERGNWEGEGGISERKPFHLFLTSSNTMSLTHCTLC